VGRYSRIIRFYSMMTNLDCFPCFLRQALEAARMATDHEEIQRKVLNSVLSILSNISIYSSPPEIALLVHQRVKAITGNLDPYKEAKKNQNELALKYEDILRDRIRETSNPLKVAMISSAAGNTIDLAPDQQMKDICKKCMEIISRGFSWDDYELFCKKVVQSKSLLYLGDNAGEIVWNKILIFEISIKFRKGDEWIWMLSSGSMT
jgi:uncharacterized protein with ATP-grasp and redox domains